MTYLDEPFVVSSTQTNEAYCVCHSIEFSSISAEFLQFIGPCNLARFALTRGKLVPLLFLFSGGNERRRAIVASVAPPVMHSVALLQAPCTARDAQCRIAVGALYRP